MRCAVTGANGFVGSHLVDRLVAEGHQVSVLVRPTADLRWLGSGDRIKVVHGSVGDPDALDRCFDGCDWVFHLAGVTSSTSAEEFHRVNSQGTRAAAEACLRAAPTASRFVLVSSLAAVGPGRDGVPLDETCEPRPVNHYGRSKLAGEREAEALADRLPLCIVRPGGIYGPRDRDVVVLLKLAQKGFRIRVGLASRAINFCHVSDVVSGILLAAERDEARDQVFNIGDPDNYQLDEVSRIMVQVLGGGRGFPLWLPVSVAYALGASAGVAARFTKGRPTLTLDRIRLLTARNWMMDVDKARRLLGYQPRYNLRAGVAHTIEWCREQGWLR
jgi:nucleoside-diphosphate-sugar epimerase